MLSERPAADIVFVAFDGIQALDLTGPHEVFAGANSATGSTAYRLTVVSVDGGPVETESGLTIGTAAVQDAPADIDTLVVPGGDGSRSASHDERLLDVVGQLATRSRRVMSVCTGAFVLAAAGAMDGRTVTTHWARADALRRRFPQLNVDPEPVYIEDGPVWSSAGVTAGIDLSLAVVEQDHGPEVAQTVARWLVMFLRRPGGQSQFAVPVWTDRAELDSIRSAQDLVASSPGDDHRVGTLAARVGMSERNFARRFADEVGVSPARYVTSIRVEAARRDLETTVDTVSAIALRTGFGTDETMRRAFTRRLGVTPDDYRRRFHRRPEHDQSTARSIP